MERPTDVFKGGVAVITGAGSGIGEGLARTAAELGMRLALADVHEERLAKVAAELREMGATVLAVPTDVADRAQCERLVERTAAAFGRIDALVNSAYAPGKFGPIESADLNDWRGILDVNLFGTMQLTQAVIPVMKKQGGGAIVMINSMVTRKPVQYQGGYTMSKAALSGSKTSERERRKRRNNAAAVTSPL